jgi:hypothetical protein
LVFEFFSDEIRKIIEKTLVVKQPHDCDSQVNFVIAIPTIACLFGLPAEGMANRSGEAISISRVKFR